MAYESNDIQEIVKVIKLTDFTELRVTKVSDENNNLKAFDLRNWYCTQKDPEMKPTQKGVRIKKEDLKEVLEVISANLED